jgi:hypothetical protein
MGDVDVSIQLVAHNNAEVYSFVTEVVANIPGVRRTTTLIVPVILKDVYQWHIPGAALQPGRGRSQQGGTLPALASSVETTG